MQYLFTGSFKDNSLCCSFVFAFVQGGKPSTKEAKLAHAAAKPSNRARPTRFTTNMLMLVYWQAKLLTALVDVE